MEGFVRLDEGGIATVETAARHICFIDRIDGGRRGCPWGRLRFTAECDEGVITAVHAFATDDEQLIAGDEIRTYDSVILDPNEPMSRKRRLFDLAGASKFVGKNDVLLYEQEGRHLWLCVEVLGQGSATLRDFEVFSPRDNFLGSFPEIYRVDGEFFHRYLAVFSSLYYDLQTTIDSLDSLLDADAAPKEALPILAGWLGLDPYDGVMSEERFRTLLKAAFELIRAKGTRKAVNDVLSVFLDTPFYIIEQREAKEIMDARDREVCERLYGDSSFDLTIMVRQAPDERLRDGLRYLIRQFAPLRTRVELVFLENVSRLDDHTYCDINARVTGFGEGRLDAAGSMLDGVCHMAGDEQ
jgi:phage tail-like protein